MKGNSSDHISGLQLYPLSMQRKLQTAFWVSIITVYLLSFLDIAGWAFNITLFKSILPQWTPMKLITSLCFIVHLYSIGSYLVKTTGSSLENTSWDSGNFHLYNKPDNYLCISVYL